MGTNRISFADQPIQYWVDIILQKERWSTAKDAVDFASRMHAGRLKVSKECNSTKAVECFKSYPEFFVYEQNLEYMLTKFNPTFMDSEARVRKENFNRLIRNLSEAAHVIYNKEVMAKIDSSVLGKQAVVAKPEHSEHEEDLIAGKSYANLFDEPKGNKARQMKRKFYKKIDPVLKVKFAHDETPLDIFAPKTDKGLKFSKYLKDRGITTVGDFVSLNKKAMNNMQAKAISDKDSSLSVIRQGVLDYINAKIAKENGETYVTEAKNTESEEKTKEPEIYERVRSYPAENFVKGSEEMNKIHQEFASYLIELSEPYIDAGLSEEEIEEQVLNIENKKFHAIIDKKRAEYEEELKKAQEEAHKEGVRAGIRKIIEDGTNYHHDKNAFTQTDLERGAHKHFRNGNPRSLDGKDF